MTPAQARALYLDHCTVGGMEQYGEKAAVAAIVEATADISRHITHLIYAIDHGYFAGTGLSDSAFVEPLRAYADPSFQPTRSAAAWSTPQPRSQTLR